VIEFGVPISEKTPTVVRNGTIFIAPCKLAMAAAAVTDDPSCIE